MGNPFDFDRSVGIVLSPGSRKNDRQGAAQDIAHSLGVGKEVTEILMRKAAQASDRTSQTEFVYMVHNIVANGRRTTE